MLLTLVTRPLATQLVPADDRNGTSAMLSLPDFAITQLQLRGINVPASMLAGWTLEDLDGLRDRADKVGCPCLVLIEDTPLEFGDPDPELRAASRQRIERLAVAAHRLGCNALGIACSGKDDEGTFDRVATGIKAAMPVVERMELNLLIAPARGLTFEPDRLTDLIKRVGGFRIGSLPSFGHAAETGDLVGTLRKLAPYAGAVHATIAGFTPAGDHRGYDLGECVTAIRSVGFVNTLAIDYPGKKDMAGTIEQARLVLQSAIDAEL